VPQRISRPREAKITGRTLHLYGPFDAELAAKIFELPERERLAIRTLDLSDIDSIFADGALPVAADFLRHGTLLRIRCEGALHIAQSLDLHGWRTLFTDGRLQLDSRIPQRIQHLTGTERIDGFVTASVRAVMQKLRCATDVVRSFEWSLSEVVGNVFTHSESPIGGLAQSLMLPQSKVILFSVVDSGIGLRRSLSKRYKGVVDDPAAIRLAIQKGVTRDTNAGQGWGLFGTSRIASTSGGHLSIWSGTGKLVIDQSGRAEYYVAPYFNGTAVNFLLQTDRGLSLHTAIEAVYDPASIVFNDYEGIRGLATFKLTDHASAFSDRAIGKKLRNIVLNVLMEPNNEVCVVDFANVRVVASSFADEFLGKMASELGSYFETRIRLINISEDNQRIVATAIATRLASNSGRGR
jgi:hypothetical protein